MALAVRRIPAALSWRLVRQASRRLSWGVADQAMSSVSNFAVNIYIARTLGAAQYGAFALAYVTYGFALNASRGLVHRSAIWSGSAARTYPHGAEPSPSAPGLPPSWAW